MKRREYDVCLVFNGIEITKVIIDSHYELKHADSINDEIILALVKQLDGLKFPPENVKQPYSYFSLDKLELNGRFYKLVWLLEDHQIYIGIVNAYRR